MRLFGALVLVLVLATPGWPALVDEWSFDQTDPTREVGAYGTVLTFRGTPQRIPSRYGMGVRFTGTSGATFAPTVLTSSTWSLTLWAQRGAVVGVIDRVVHRCTLPQWTDPGAIEIQFRRETAVRWNTATHSTEALIAQDTTWHHWAFVQRATTREIWRDGALLVSAPRGPEASCAGGSNPDLQLGSNGFDGVHVVVDNLRFYDHGVSASEILSDMQTPVAIPNPVQKPTVTFQFRRVAGLILEFQDNAEDAGTNVAETGFRVYRSIGCAGTPIQLTTLPAHPGTGLVWYTDFTVTPGQDYGYSVTAFNLTGESLPSNTACGTSVP